MIMYTVKIQNSTGDTIQLYPSSDYMLMSMTGITPADATINATETASQDGATFNSSHVMPRNIVITFDIRGEGAIVRKRRIELYRYIKTKRPVRVFLANDQRSVYTDGYVERMDDAGTIFSQREQFQLSIICPDPFFRDNETGERVISFSAVTGLFNFPFAIGSPIPFSTRERTYLKTIENDGDVPCGVTLRLISNGAISNPWFYNETTGQRMTFDIDLETGDELVVSTVQGHKSATLVRAGAETNVINALSHDSKWITLEPGDNTFYYNADDGATNMQLVFVYNILFEGI